MPATARSRATPVLALSLALALAAAVGVAEAQTRGGIVLRSRTIVRVAPPRVVQDDPRLKWKEGKAAKCQPLGDFRAALSTGERHMDLLMRNGTRLRARFDKRCRAADFYAGFYVRPSPDGMLCADRDTVRARSGMTCRIEKFRRLTLDD